MAGASAGDRPGAAATEIDRDSPQTAGPPSPARTVPTPTRRRTAGQGFSGGADCCREAGHSYGLAVPGCAAVYQPMAAAYRTAPAPRHNRTHHKGKP